MQTPALFLYEDLNLRLGQREVGEPDAGEALVRIEFAGVCGSDLHAIRSGAWIEYWPAVLGHEIVGVVDGCPGGEIAVGTRVVVDSRLPCHQCAGCARALNQCEVLAWVGERRPGGYQCHASFDVRSLHACPPSLEPSIAVLAEPLAVALHAVNAVNAVNAVGTTPAAALILGYGPIGSLVHLVIGQRWPGAEVSVTEVNPDRRRLAEALGASTEVPNDHRWPVVFDAAGYSGSLLDATRLVQNGGTVVLVALAHAPVSVLPADIVEHAVTLVGVNGFDDELTEAIDLLAARPDIFRPVITEALLLDEAAERIRNLDTAPATGKVVIAL